MASSMDQQQWRLQHHQTRIIMDNSASTFSAPSGVHFSATNNSAGSQQQFTSNRQNHNQSASSRSGGSIMNEQPANQTSPIANYHPTTNNVHSQQNLTNYAPSAVYSSHHSNTGNNQASFGSADLYYTTSGECTNPGGVYDQAASLSPFGQYHHLSPTAATATTTLLFGQPATPTTTASAGQPQYYTTAPAPIVQDPYYSPAAISCYPADYQHHNQYPAYAYSYGQPEDVLQVETSQTRAFASSGPAHISGPGPGPTGTGLAPPESPAEALGAIKSVCCSSSTLTSLGATKQQPKSSGPQEAIQSSGEPVALLDSTSSQPLTSERRIKQSKGPPSKQRQPEHLISSCHTNRVRAGPLGIIARRKNATRETTAILKEWLDEHGHNPYPSKGEKIMLSCVTKMSMTQVSTWFANARRRMKKEKRSFWANNSAGPSGSGNNTSAGPTTGAGGSLSRGAPNSLTKVKSEYAKVVLASSTGCPALKYFMQKHHRQMMASTDQQTSLAANRRPPHLGAPGGGGAQEPCGPLAVATSTQGQVRLPGSAAIGAPPAPEAKQIKREVVSDTETTSSSASSSSSSSSPSSSSSSSSSRSSADLRG